MRVWRSWWRVHPVVSVKRSAARRYGGVLGPWGHARRRWVAMPGGWRAFRPRRSRCRRCGRTHVLLPAGLWSRRRYGAAVIQAVLVLAAQAAAAGRVPARPFTAVP